MDMVLTKKSRMLLVLPLTLLVLALGQVSRPAAADAAATPYCNPATLGGYQACVGGWMNFYQLYGWGDQHSVCVNRLNWEKRCSSGPGAGVYSPVYSPPNGYPAISNNAAGSNTVHGIALS